LKIIVNTRLLLKDKLEGLGWFTYETLKRITQQHPEHEFIFLFDRKFDQEFIFSDNITPIIVYPQARHPFLFYLWFEHSIPKILKKVKPDLFLSPDGYLSLSTDIKSLPVIHDLNFEHYPKDMPWLYSKYYRYFFPKFAKKATRIATVSNFSKQDIINLYGIVQDKIDVVYDGVNEIYKPISESEKKITLKKYTNGKPYFVFVSSLHPRKNISNLFKSFELLKKDGYPEIKLLVVGAKKWWTANTKNIYQQMKYKDDVIFCGRLLPAELNKVICSALAMTYVSYFEGFGIPILEAFRCNTPVITSNTSSMPEVANDAALLIDPFSPSSICNAMKQIINDSSVREKLILKGQIREKQFSWQKTADKLWNSIEKAVNT
jgi:glycosyltransferase involved in cell wall biosynthesis